MGGSLSSNIIDLTMNAIATVTNDFAVDQIQSANASTSVYIEGYETVFISGLKQEATAKVTGENIADIIQNNEVQQDLVSVLSQTAKSLIDGIPIASFSEAKNEILSGMSATVTLVNKSSSLCLSDADAQANIVGIYDGGSSSTFTLLDSSQTSVAEVVASCYAKAMQDNSAVQKMTALLDQKAESTIKGLDLLGFLGAFGFLAVILLLALLALPVASALWFKSMFKYMLLIAAIGVIVGSTVMIFAFSDNTDPMSHRGYAKNFTQYPACRAQTLRGPIPLYDPESGEKTGYASALAASDACEKDEDCLAFYYEVGKVDEDCKEQCDLTPHTYTDTDGLVHADPKTTFFKTIDVDNCAVLEMTNSTENSGDMYTKAYTNAKDQQRLYALDNTKMYGIYGSDPDPDIIEYLNNRCGEAPAEDQKSPNDENYDCFANKALYRQEGFVWITVKLNQSRGVDDVWKNYAVYRLKKVNNRYDWIFENYIDPQPSLDVETTVDGVVQDGGADEEWKNRKYVDLHAYSFGTNNDNYAADGFKKEQSTLNGVEEFEKLKKGDLLPNAFPHTLVMDVISYSEMRVARKDDQGEWVVASAFQGSGLYVENFCKDLDVPEAFNCFNTAGYKKLVKNDASKKAVGYTLFGIGLIMFLVSIIMIVSDAINKKPDNKSNATQGVKVDPQKKS